MVLVTQATSEDSSLRTCAVSPESSLFAHISMEADEVSDPKSRSNRTDENYHNLMTWLNESPKGDFVQKNLRRREK